jgi:hypothetical protein
MMAEFNYAIQQIIESGDWQTLVGMLGNPRKSADLRAQAALALAELQIPEAGDALLEAIFGDPSQEVRDAAFEALKSLVGSETTRLAIESYGEEPAPLGQAPANEVEEAGELQEQIHWGPDDITGLTSIISSDTRPAQRIKALRALGQIAHHEAVNYLTYMALWEEDDAVRRAAYECLQERYGDELDNFLAEQRASQLAGEGLTEEDLVDLPDEEENQIDEAVGERPVKTAPTVSPKPASKPVYSHTPVVQEENPTRGFLLALAFVIILAFIFYFLFYA